MDTVLLSRGGKVDFVNRSRRLWCPGLLRGGQRVAIAGVVQEPIILVTVWAEGDFDRVLTLVLQSFALCDGIRIGARRKQADLLIQGVSGAENGSELIRTGVEKAKLPQLRAQVVRILRIA